MRLFQIEDLDMYDSDYDDISNSQVVLMANISNYGSDVISKVPHSETYLNDMENQLPVTVEPRAVDLANSLVSTSIDQDAPSSKPMNFKQVMTKPLWIDAMQEEIHEFERLQVWELVSYPDKVFLIKLKQIYKVKTDEFSEVLKNKARLVAQSFRQEEGIDFKETFVTVARI
nr:Gag-Pol polyprotein [Tanacetum cinerariifolium]